MQQSKDPLTASISKLLWPYLKSEGFVKTSGRKFSREINGVIQQLWVDANGVSGKSSTLIVLCANFPFGSVNGYMDPHGFRICEGRRWNTSETEIAEKSMCSIVSILKESEIGRLNSISSVEIMLESLEKHTQRNWYATYSEMYERWRRNDPEVVAVYQENKKKLKL